MNSVHEELDATTRQMAD